MVTARAGRFHHKAAATGRDRFRAAPLPAAPRAASVCEDEHVRSSWPRPSVRAAVAADAVAIVGFVVVGVAQHGSALTVAGLLRTVVPLMLAWFLVALAIGTYRRVGWPTALLTWLVAVPVGLLARSVLRGGPWGRPLLVFGGVAMVFTFLFVMGGRVALLVATVVRGRSAPTTS